MNDQEITNIILDNAGGGEKNAMCKGEFGCIVSVLQSSQIADFYTSTHTISVPWHISLHKYSQIDLHLHCTCVLVWGRQALEGGFKYLYMFPVESSLALG